MTDEAMSRFDVPDMASLPEDVDGDDFEQLEAHSFSRRAIWDIGSVAAFFNLSKRGVLRTGSG